MNILLSKHEKKIKILCLMTVTRAGSKFFHSLLDGHPDIICFPRKFHFAPFWSTIELSSPTADLILDNFIKKYRYYFNGKLWYRFNKYELAGQLGPDRDETFTVDIDLFRSYFKEIISEHTLNRRNVFLSLHFAYHLACGKQIPENPLLFYHIHDVQLELNLRFCAEDFKNIRVLVTTRNPLQSLNSEINGVR